MMEDAKLAAFHAKRVTLMKKDWDLVLRIRGMNALKKTLKFKEPFCP